jgi:predicted RND superfamily exporter protein
MLRKMLKHSKLIVAVSIALTAFFAWQLRGVEIENTVRLYMPHDSDSYRTLLKTEEDFGSMIVMGISLETDEDSIITPENLAVIQKITDSIEPLKYIDKVQSITNIDYVSAKDGALSAESLLGQEYTGSKEDMAGIKERLYSWQEMYNRVIITDDEKATQIMIILEPHDENGNPLSAGAQTAVLHQMKDITEEIAKDSGLEIRYFGDPVLTDDAKSYMIRDLMVLIPFVILIVLLSLYFSFHSWAGTLLPLITVLMSTIWSCGLMAMLNITFTIVASVIPVTLIACGSAYGIHVLTHYYIALEKTEGELTEEKHEDAIMFGLKDVWVAVLLAAVTTIAGFISNVTSPIQPLRSFSVFSDSGVAFALLLSVTLIPAMLYLTPLSKAGKRAAKKLHLSQKIRAKIERELARRGGRTGEEANADTLYKLYYFFGGTTPRLFVYILLILGLSVAGIKKVAVDTALVNYFPPNSQFRQDIAYVDEKLAGTNGMYFIVEGTSPLKQAVEAMQADVEKTRYSKVLNALNSLPLQTAASVESDSTAAEETAEDWGDFDFTDTADSNSDQTAQADNDWGDFDFGEESAETAEESSKYDLNTLQGAVDNLREICSTKAGKQALLDGYNALTIAVNKDFKGCMTNPEILKAVDGMNEYLLAKYNGIGKLVSFTTFIKRINQVMNAPAVNDNRPLTTEQAIKMLNDAYTLAGGKNADVNDIVVQLEKSLNYNGAAYNEIPYDAEKYPVASREELSNLITQYLYLLSSDSIEQFADDMTNPSSIRTQVQLRTHSSEDTGVIIADAAKYAEDHFPEGYTFKATGNGEMEHTMTRMVVSSQLTSIIFSLVMVFLIISLSFKSGWAGLIGAIPLGLTIMLNFMVMGFAGIRLDLVTSIVSSVAIGVGIDYTIHFMETYRALRMQSSDLEAITKETFKTSGKGIITNAIAVGLGFVVLLLSKFIILRYIGVLVAIVMFTSSALAMTIIPGVLNTFDPKFMWSKEQRAEYDAKLNR